MIDRHCNDTLNWGTKNLEPGHVFAWSSDDFGHRVILLVRNGDAYFDRPLYEGGHFPERSRRYDYDWTIVPMDVGEGDFLDALFMSTNTM